MPTSKLMPDILVGKFRYDRSYAYTRIFLLIHIWEIWYDRSPLSTPAQFVATHYQSRQEEYSAKPRDVLSYAIIHQVYRTWFVSIVGLYLHGFFLQDISMAGRLSSTPQARLPTCEPMLNKVCRFFWGDTISVLPSVILSVRFCRLWPFPFPVRFSSMWYPQLVLINHRFSTLCQQYHGSISIMADADEIKSTA
jgi:hypothetical protein